MDSPFPVDLGRIAQDLQIRRVQVESVVQLLDEGNTVPFITRYRKERTGGLNEQIIREVQGRVGRLRDLADRKQTILKAIEAQGKLTEELAEAIRTADTSKRLEDLYLPYKPKKRTKASDARDKGLEPLALRIWNRDESLVDLQAAANEFVKPDEKGLESAEKVLEGVGYILAESISELANVREAVRRTVWKLGKIVTAKAEKASESKGLDYRDYFNYTEPVAHIPPHRVLAINRGDKENILRIKLEVPRDQLERTILDQLPLEDHPHREFFTSATIDALDRLLMPSLEREIRRDLTEMAEKHAVDVFARNLRSLLLQPPINRQTVLAIDPGFRTGCKVAVLDPHGNLLEFGTIHPHQPQNRRHEAKQFLKELVGKHQVDVVAIGNGTACRETEELVAEIIAEGTHFHQNPEVPFPGTEAAAKPSDKPAKAEAEAAKPAEEAPKPSEASPSTEPEAAATTTETAAKAEEAAVKTESTETAEPKAATPTEATGGEPAQAEPETSAAETLLPAEAAPATESPVPADATAEAETSATEEPTTSNSNGPAESDSSADGESKPKGQPTSEAIPPISGGAPEDDSASASMIPPIAGGAPEEESADSPSEPQPTPTEEQPTPIETVPPPPASAAETAEPEAEAQKAEQLETPGQTESPATPDVPESETPSPTTEAAPPEGPTSQAQAETAATVEAAAASAIEGETPEPKAEAEPVTTTQEQKPEAEPEQSPATTEKAPDAEKKTPAAATPLTQPPKGPTKARADQPRPSRPKGPPPPPKPHSADAQLAKLAYVIVNEAGASVYSASAVGREEFPDYDAEQRGTISIGRRLQDPLAELVKIEPQNIGVGLYQHDVNPKQLKQSLESVIESCVNFVGVDLNTASVPLLQHVSGLNSLTARRIADFRKEKGPFQNREQLKEIDGVGPVTFTQAAGFLKLNEGANPLDRTWVHPESYPAAEKLLEKLEFSTAALTDKDQNEALKAKLAELDVPALAKELEIGEPTLRDIIDALARPGRDPREDLPKPIFKRGVLKLEDLQAGMELKGTVLNVVDFGAFVDIGLKDSGLVHISQLANRYVKSPHDVVSVGDVVTVWVMGVDQERKRVSLTMVQPGTERPRGERGRRGDGEGAPRGGRGRGPRRGAAAAGASSQGAPATPRPGTQRIPGPPLRAQQGGGRGRGPGRGGPGRGRGGPHHAAQREAAPSRPISPRKARPAPPPAPLSQDALSGSAPLRTFGQLKQLYEARQKSEEEQEQTTPSTTAAESTPTPSVSPEQTQATPADPPAKRPDEAPLDPTPPSPTESQGPGQEDPNPDPQPQTEQED